MEAPTRVAGEPSEHLVAAPIAAPVAAPDAAPIAIVAPTDATADEASATEVEPAESARPLKTLALVGIGLAAAAELYLQFAEPAPRTKITGVMVLVAAAVLFGLATAAPFLPASLRRMRFPQRSPAQVFHPGPPLIAGAVGALTFLALVGRLWFGSVASSDVLLWIAALVAIAVPIMNDVRPRLPAREYWPEIGGVLALTLLFIILCARDINHWYYTAIGDEYAFYSAALGILTDGIRRPFVQDGVYGAHPVLGTMFQSLVMVFAGRNRFGWVFSSVMSTALAIPALYLIGRALGGRAVGLLGAAMLAFCHYIFAFSHMGYNNILAPTPVAWAIAFLVLSMRRPHPGFLYASGLAAGLGFYTYYTARTAMPILGLFILAQYGWRGCLTPQGLRQRLLELWPLLLAFVLAVLPLFAASGTAVITKMSTFVPGGYNGDSTGLPGQTFLMNFWLNAPAFFYNPSTAYFTSYSLLDPVTGALTVLGIGLAIRWWARPLCKLMLVWTGLAVAVTALISPPAAPVTWLLFAVPPLAILGALAARQVWRMVPWPVTDVPETADRLRRRADLGATVGLLLVVIALNMYRFWVTTPKTMHLTSEAVVMEALRSGECGPDFNRTILVMRGDGLIRLVLTSLGPARDLPQIITQPQLRPNEPISLNAARCVIFADPNDEPAQRALDALKRAHPSGVVTQFTDYAGITRVQVFRPAATAQ